jgi:hypothetical protein
MSWQKRSPRGGSYPACCPGESRLSRAGRGSAEIFLAEQVSPGVKLGMDPSVSLPVDAPEPEKASLCTKPGMLAAVAGLFGTDAAALTLLDADQSEVWVAASTLTARLAQDLEYTLGEGPARDATAGNRVILEHGPGLPTRWRHYGPALRQFGIEAVAAVPLPWSAGYLGALTVFDPDGPAMGSLRAVARDLALAVLNADAQPALLAQGDHRAQVHQAVGIVSVQCGCGVAEALLLLKAYSYAHGEGIASVAARVLRHELRFDVS